MNKVFVMLEISAICICLGVWKNDAKNEDNPSAGRISCQITINCPVRVSLLKVEKVKSHGGLEGLKTRTCYGH